MTGGEGFLGSTSWARKTEIYVYLGEGRSNDDLLKYKENIIHVFEGEKQYKLIKRKREVVIINSFITYACLVSLV